MSISFECSDCGEALKVKEQYAGRKIKCPHCEAVIRVPAAEEESEDDDGEEVVSRRRSSAASSRSKGARRSQTRRSRASEDEEIEEELPQPSRKKKKKGSGKSKSGSGGKIPVWAIVAGASVVGVLLIAVVVFVASKPGGNGQVAGGGQAPPEAPAKVQAQVDGPGAKFRMKLELPAKWTSEGSIEDEMFPWATLKGDGQSIKLSSNRSLLGGAESMTTLGGAVEQLKASHSNRGNKLKAENNDWVDGPLNVHEGKRALVIYSDYEYKGVFGKGYGIRCTVEGPVFPCTLMLECGESGRDKWRPTLLEIAESIHYVAMKDGQEDRDDMDAGPGGQPDVDQPEMDGDPGDM